MSFEGFCAPIGKQRALQSAIGPLKTFLKDESRQDLIDYALVAAMSTLATNIATEFNHAGSSV